MIGEVDPCNVLGRCDVLVTVGTVVGKGPQLIPYYLNKEIGMRNNLCEFREPREHLADQSKELKSFVEQWLSFSHVVKTLVLLMT